MVGGNRNHSARSPHGYVIVTNLDGKLREYDTLQCAHCSRHFVVVPGSGKRRGYCTNCAGPTCGRQACDACIPSEKKLGIAEGSVNPTATTVTVPKLWLPGDQ